WLLPTRGGITESSSSPGSSHFCCMTSSSGDQMAPPQSTRSRPVVRFIVLAIVVVLCAPIALVVLSPGTVSNSPPNAARSAQCADNLRNLAMALQTYAAAKDHFPPPYTTDANGKPLHSWRTLILPYLDQAPVFDAIHRDEPWDSPTNLRATQRKLE